ncbi:MAG: GGDEF domain-containing protein [Amphritea sp.]
MDEIKLDVAGRLDAFGIYPAHKKRLLYVITLFCSLTFIPLVIKNVVQGQFFLSAVMTAFLVALYIDVFAVAKNQHLRIHPNIVISLLVITLITTVQVFGLIGVFWSYPVIIVLLFILPLRLANFFNCIIILALTLLAVQNISLDIAVRLCVSLILTAAITTIILLQIEKLQNRLREQSIKDPLTGAFNRRQLNIYLQDSLAQKERYDVNAYVLMIDADNFKKINDQHGHDVGDVVLKRIVSIVAANTRDTDLLFRVGGEEFVLLIRDTSIDHATRIAQALCKQISEQKIIESQMVSVSVGISGVAKGVSVDSWLKFADQALYRAKKLGRNRIEIHEGVYPVSLVEG